MYRVAWPLIVVGFLLLAASVTSGNGELGPLEELQSEKSATRAHAYEKVGAEIEVEHLGKKYYKYPFRDSKHLATLLLGEFRAVEAIPVLLKNVEYKNHKSLATDYDQTWPTWYPAAEALAKIGMPAVKPLFDELSGISELNRRRKLCCNILIEIMGKELASFALKEHLAEVKDETKKANLEAGLKFIESWDNDVVVDEE
jgi:hypothetical protein